MTYLDPDYAPDLYLITIETDPASVGIPEITPSWFPLKDFGNP